MYMARKTKYDEHMKQLYPERYEGLEFDYAVGEWYNPQKRKKKHSRKKHKLSAIYKANRLFVLQRDGYKCRSCGAIKRLAVHHIMHRENGGCDEPHNLVTLCAKCHAEQHKDDPVYKLMKKGLDSSGD